MTTAAYLSAVAQLSLTSVAVVLAWFGSSRMPGRPRWALRIFVAGMFLRRILGAAVDQGSWGLSLQEFDQSIWALVQCFLICGFCFELFRWLALDHARPLYLDETSRAGAGAGGVYDCPRVRDPGVPGGDPVGAAGAREAGRGPGDPLREDAGGAERAGEGEPGPQLDRAGPSPGPDRRARVAAPVAAAAGMVAAVVLWLAAGRLEPVYVSQWAKGRSTYQLVTPKSAGLEYHQWQERELRRAR